VAGRCQATLPVYEPVGFFVVRPVATHVLRCVLERGHDEGERPTPHETMKDGRPYLFPRANG
jgi:hypothetical protein